MKAIEFKVEEYRTPDCCISEILESSVLCTSGGVTTDPWEQGGEYNIFN